MRIINPLIKSYTECKICGTPQTPVSKQIGVCGDCIKNHPQEALTHTSLTHQVVRKHFKLPMSPPKDPTGVQCTVCVNNCQIPVGGRGYCGLVYNQKGVLLRKAGGKNNGLASWYYDSLPTNCVASWVCPAGSSSGYPKYSKVDGPEYGLKNLAVFYGSCSFNCLFCQNWTYKENTTSLSPMIRSSELADMVDGKTSCICYFGGDPTTQIYHSIETSRLALEKARDANQILRICWETNASLNPSLMKTVASLALESGGIIKIDMKAFNDNLNRALCGSSNQNTLENFKMVAQMARHRRDPPLVVASTLMIPGYVQKDEIREIAKFIAMCDPATPYSLLAFAPTHVMRDLPLMSRKDASRCKEAALEEGLAKVKLSNLHLLT